MEEILHHLGCIKPCKYLDKLLIPTGEGFLLSTVFLDIGLGFDVVVSLSCVPGDAELLPLNGEKVWILLNLAVVFKRSIYWKKWHQNPWKGLKAWDSQGSMIYGILKWGRFARTNPDFPDIRGPKNNLLGFFGRVRSRWTLSTRYIYIYIHIIFCLWYFFGIQSYLTSGCICLDFLGIKHRPLQAPWQISFRSGVRLPCAE